MYVEDHSEYNYHLPHYLPPFEVRHSLGLFFDSGTHDLQLSSADDAGYDRA